MGGRRVSKSELFRGLFQGSILGGLWGEILEDFDDFWAPLGSLFGDIWPLLGSPFLGHFFEASNEESWVGPAAGAGSLELSN